MPRICQLITRMIVGGAQRLVLETAGHLQDLGWESEIWCGPQSGREGSLLPEAARRGIPVRIFDDLVREVSPWHDLRAWQRVRDELARGKFDILHTHCSKAGILGRAAAPLAGTPVCLHTAHAWAMTPDTPWVWRQIYTHLERRAARWADALIAVSAAVRDAGLEAGIGDPGDYRVIHGGIGMPEAASRTSRERARTALGVPATARVAGTIGRLDHAKDPLGALRALLPLLQAEQDVHAVFIGDGPLADELTAATAQASVRERIHLVGRRVDASALCAAFDVFFLSSRWEGFPLAVLEAMATGLPVVAYDVAGVGEAIIEGETGHLISPGRPEAWRNRLAALLRDPDAARTFGLAGSDRVRAHFSLGRMLTATVALYEECLCAQRAPALFQAEA